MLSRNLIDLEVGETGLSAVNRRRRPSIKTNSSASIGAILVLSNKFAINIQFEITAIGNH